MIDKLKLKREAKLYITKPGYTDNGSCKIDYKNLSWVWGLDRKSILKITNYHHQACQMMTNCDREGRIFLSHPQTNNGLVFLVTTKYFILYWKKKTFKSLPENPELSWNATWCCPFNITMALLIDVRPRCGCSFFILLMGWYGYVR